MDCSTRRRHAYNTTGDLTQIQLPGYTASPRKDVVDLTYYANGRLNTLTDGNGITRTYTYNGSSFLTGVSYASPYNTQSVSFTPDTYNRRSGMSDSTGGATYSYDDADDVTGVTTTYTGLVAKSMSYTYWPTAARTRW